jgi:hypothetical protein
MIETSRSIYGRDRMEVEKEMTDSFKRRLQMIQEEKKRLAELMPPPNRS